MTLLAEDFLEHFPQFNPTGPVFRALIGDLDRPELDVITKANDINKGAIFNVIEWHRRFQEYAKDCSVFDQADSWFLDKWTTLLGIRRPGGMTDEEFIGYVIGYVLSSLGTITKVSEIFPEPDFHVFNSDEIGFVSDYSVTDLGVIDPTTGGINPSSVFTFPRNATYVLVDDPTIITELQLEKIIRVLAAGTALFIGEY